MIETIRAIPMEMWNTLGEMAPYLLFGFLVAGVLSVLIRPETVERHLGGHGLWPVVKATLFGIPLPLCSCGVIPVGASLRKHGASSGATTAFLLSTPQTGVDSIVVTFSLLGPVFTVFRPVVAGITGILGGFLVDISENDKGSGTSKQPNCEDACCNPAVHESAWLRALRYGFLTLPRDIGKPLVIGLVIAGLISALVPDDYFSGVLGTGFLGMFVMMLVGIPLYVCATASVPIAAALIAKGVSAGAALVFLMTGPATNAATIAAVWQFLGKRVVAIYLGTVIVVAFASGTFLNLVYPAGSGMGIPHLHGMTPSSMEAIWSIILLVVLAVALWPKSGRRQSMAEPGADEPAFVLPVKGMTCEHCAQAVRRALLECVGVASAEVDLHNGTATIHGDNLDILTLRNAIEALGYNTHEGDDRIR